jgi:hypothetical protein
MILHLVCSAVHNANFELLHISLLREYLGLEFETKEFDSRSKFELEPTIDDFVFMTFFVGNDFLPHLPALDIGDEAFDLLFYAYKKNRVKWLKDGLYRRNMGTAINSGKTKSKRHPYLTDAGNITSGKVRLSKGGAIFYARYMVLEFTPQPVQICFPHFQVIVSRAFWPTLAVMKTHTTKIKERLWKKKMNECVSKIENTVGSR